VLAAECEISGALQVGIVSQPFLSAVGWLWQVIAKSMSMCIPKAICLALFGTVHIAFPSIERVARACPRASDDDYDEEFDQRESAAAAFFHLGTG
jgi:hypothetical protein